MDLKSSPRAWKTRARDFCDLQCRLSSFSKGSNISLTPGLSDPSPSTVTPPESDSSSWDVVFCADPSFSLQNALHQSLRNEAEDDLLDTLFSSSPLSSAPSSPVLHPQVLHEPPDTSLLPIIPSIPIALAVPQPAAPSSKKKPSKKAKDKRQGHERRKRKRSEAYLSARDNVQAKMLALASTVATNAAVEEFRVAPRSFVGKKITFPQTLIRYRDVSGPGAPLRLVQWRQNRPKLILDDSRRIVAVCAGHPTEGNWLESMSELTACLAHARASGTFSQEAKEHQRGNFAILASGCSHGGRRKWPCSLNPKSHPNHAVTRELVENPAMLCLVSFMDTIVPHQNVALAPHETRYSITQYTAGAVLRWLEHDMQSHKDFLAHASAERLEEANRKDMDRWKFGLTMFSTLDEMAAQVNRHS
ncbi:hypothetical protein H0H92_004582 [Tricholoma furcatifolium]|nr:hypothetical protein H0H92_004582 [Tricholoma furcatifolium]